MRKVKFSKMALSDQLLLIVGYILLGMFVVAIIIPIIYIIIASFMDPITLQNSGISFDLNKWTTTAYERVVTLFAAYPMSRVDFKGRGIFNTIFMITMFFGGGLIPTYLLISNLGLLNSMWAVILPGAFSVWNMIIARTYYQGIPSELREAADVDGANELTYFFMILLPVCTKQPLQLVLRSILIQNQPESGMIADMQSTAARAQLAELLKYATIIISSLPLLIMYPFFQKYFDSGIMVGSVKG